MAAAPSEVLRAEAAAAGALACLPKPVDPRLLLVEHLGELGGVGGQQGSFRQVAHALGVRGEVRRAEGVGLGDVVDVRLSVGRR